MEDGLNVMSYNVMQFYSLSDRRKNTYEDIKAFVEQEQPDVLCFQEYSTSLDGKFEKYKYKVKNDYKENLKTTIFSKYPIINSEPLDFDSSNSGILADIVVRNDTVRVFSIHFESLNLHPDIDIYVEKPRLKFKQFKRVFPRQIDQFEIVKQHIVSSPYPVILCADTNNTPLSYLYNSLTSIGLEDTFKEAGKGYGSTFVFHGVPIRIDMIFKSEELKTLDFKNYDVKHSDHYPIMAKIKL
jgi:endonuclease/exonuclease/phosphatase family metal-dependent hydrolase